VELAVLPHLYDLAPDGAAARYLRSIGGPLAALGWLCPRAAYWVLRANGVEGRMGHTCFTPEGEIEKAPPAHRASSVSAGAQPDRTIWCFDLRGQGEVAGILSEIDRIVAAGETGTGGICRDQPSPVPHQRIEETVVPRWYPVIDYRQCTNCLECLNFCLFGVFSLDDAGKLFVEQPNACRDGCPACSRICPPGAILFPEHSDPAISGDPLVPPAHHEGDGLDRLVDELDGSDL
jgi:NAD-dependent dihydropyrimidine dehydrogenase PreA subunit